MKRIPFSQVLKTAAIDIRREYDRLYGMFCVQKFQDMVGAGSSLKDYCATYFVRLPFRGTCVSLDALSYRIIEYNHHSMKGDLERKKATLIALADKLEPKRAKLKQVSGSLESDLFYLLNSVNVRHNNADQVGKNYIHFVADMKDSDIEQWYDDMYQMCLLAFLELDHLERKERVKKLKEDIQKNG